MKRSGRRAPPKHGKAAHGSVKDLNVSTEPSPSLVLSYLTRSLKILDKKLDDVLTRTRKVDL